MSSEIENEQLIDLRTTAGVFNWLDSGPNANDTATAQRISENERLRQHIERHAADDDCFWQPACQAYLNHIKETPNG